MESEDVKLAVLAGLLLASAALSQDADSKISVDELVNRLVTETESFATDAKGFQPRRPHSLLAQLEPDSAAKVAARLSQPFTDDPIRDTYIRFHLLNVILQDKGKPLPGGPFQKFHDSLPPDTGFEAREHTTYEPPELARKYRQLIEECRVTTGFPPFQKRIGPPESFEYMDDANRKVAEAKWAQAQELRKSFKGIVDREAQQWNERIGWTPWMLRQIRGDAIYCMVRSGEPRMLEAAIGYVARNMTTDRQQASDYLSFLNAAYFDGWLAEYDKSALKTAATTLKRVVVAGDSAPKERGARKSSLSERAFTIITAMETGHVPAHPAAEDMERPKVAAKPIPKNKITAASLDLATIDNAIERALSALDDLRPPDTDLGLHSYRQRHANESARSSLLLPGHQALASWAMLSSGESRHSPWMQKRIGWIACFESADTYDRSMRLRAIASMSDPRWLPWIRRDADWLISSMAEQGGFKGSYTSGSPLAGFGDNASTAYATLGLDGARISGYEIPDKVWQKIDAHWRQSQFPEKVKGDGGGWAVRSHKSLKAGDNPNDFANQVSGPMTAGGLLSLSITERILLGPKRVNVGNNATPEFVAGLNWLDRNFSLNELGGDSDLYYYLWTIQNVGQATGYRTFNRIDWFREGTARLLEEQAADGTWKGPKGQGISTSFALLYLYRARGPLAYCKVRFEPEIPADTTLAKSRGPAWNHRPNDLSNLTEDISNIVEVPTNWQIADLDQPAYELAESATLYLATDQAFKLTDAQVARLREYIDAGGTLICAPEGNNVATALKSMRALATELYPTREPRAIDAKHPFYNLNERVTENTSISVVDNGVRPLVVIIEKDIGRDLQANDKNRRDAFRLMTNIYLFATGRDTRRPRIASNFVHRTNQSPKNPVQAVRIRYDGDFDPEPAGLQQLGAILANKHDTDLRVETLSPDALKSEHRIAFLTMTDKAKLSAGQIAALRKWLDAGGTLWLDSAGGSPGAVDAGSQLIFDLGLQHGDFKPLLDHPVMTGKTARGTGYDVTKPTFRTFGDGRLPALRAADLNGRPAIFRTESNLTAGLAGANHWGIFGFSVQTSRKFVINGVLNLKK